MNGAPPFAVITAAGASRRMGRHKALLELEGVSLLARMVAALDEAGIDRRAVVVGAARGEIESEVQRLQADLLLNTRHARGRFTSIRLAAQAAQAQRPHRALLLWPVDCPGVRPETLRRLAAAAEQHPRANLAPEYEGRCGHPVLLCPAMVERIATGPEDGNLRRLMHEAPEGRVRVPVDDPAILDNLNTPRDFERFLASRRPEAPHA